MLNNEGGIEWRVYCPCGESEGRGGRGSWVAGAWREARRPACPESSEGSPLGEYSSS